MTREQFAELACFLKNAQGASRPFVSANLIDPTSLGSPPDVVLPRRKVDEFRDRFVQLHAFACAVCDVPVKDLALIHLANYLGLLATPAPEGEAPNPTQVSKPTAEYKLEPEKLGSGEAPARPEPPGDHCHDFSRGSICARCGMHYRFTRAGDCGGPMTGMCKFCRRTTIVEWLTPATDSGGGLKCKDLESCVRAVKAARGPAPAKEGT